MADLSIRLNQIVDRFESEHRLATGLAIFDALAETFQEFAALVEQLDLVEEASIEAREGAAVMRAAVSQALRGFVADCGRNKSEVVTG